MKPNEVLNIKPTIQAWADIVIKEWVKKVEMLGIQGSALVNSFKNHVTWAAAGDLQKIEFTFDYVGKFTDMGVGNGVSLDTRDAQISAGLTTRRPKPWFTSTFYREVAILQHLISERLAQNTEIAIVHALTDESTLGRVSII